MEQLQSMKKNDEWKTPRKAVNLLLPYLQKKSVIWCPFDTQESEFVKVFCSNGNKVIYSHIGQGKDFFEYTPNVPFDCIISNPPYSIKDKVYKRLLSLNKPFAMLVNINGLWDSKVRFELFKYTNIEILIPKGRIKFINEEGTQASPPFQSVFVCHNFLPKVLCYE